MNRIKLFIVTLALAVTIGSGVVAVSLPSTVVAAGSTPACPDASFMGFPTWYRGVIDAKTCDVKVPSGSDGLSQFIWHIVLNIIDILLRLAGIIAVFFIIYGGFQFITSQASPDGAAKARVTILNAIYGLAISIASVGIIKLIMDNLL